MPRSKDLNKSQPQSPQWLSFGPTVCSELELSLEKEWWMGNGLGSYTSGTILGCLTRSRQGLFVVAAKPPAGLISLVAKLEETLYILDQPYPLSTNYFGETVYPKGYANLKRFSLNPFPTFSYEVEDFRVEKILYLRRGENTLGIHYRLVSGEEELIRLEVKPLLACRPIDEVRKNANGPGGELLTAKGQVCFKSAGPVPPIYFAHQAAIVDKDEEWIGKLTYPRDQELAEAAGEYLYTPCTFIYSFMMQDEVMLGVSTQPVRLPENPADWISEERGHVFSVHRKFARAAERRHHKILPELSQLLMQSEHFLVRRGENELSIIRGVFGETDGAWSSMIALPGLLLVPGRYPDARSVLLTYAEQMDKGFLPSRFRAEDGRPEYRSIDAALWFAEAVYLYAVASEDYAAVEKKLYPLLRRIIKHYQKGTHFGVVVDEDGLVRQDDQRIALTWMNATVRGTPVTPRFGKAVEVNALWYNALRVTQFFAESFRDIQTAKALDRAARKTYDQFNDMFWNEKKMYLYDCIQGTRKDVSFRPNQLMAMSLSFPVLKKERWEPVIGAVTQELFTPFGLKTLSRKNKAYRGRYAGDRAKRSQAEHQGTVWAWLMGPYIRAYLGHHGPTKAVRERLLRLFEPFLNQLSHYGLNAISSVYDGNAPHTARGLIGDACAAGEVIRCMDELTSEGPKKETIEKFELT